METIAHAFDGPDGKPMTALFTGPCALQAARAWAAVLHANREVLAARGAAWRRDKQRTAWRKMRGELPAEELHVNPFIAGDPS